MQLTAACAKPLKPTTSSAGTQPHDPTAGAGCARGFIGRPFVEIVVHILIAIERHRVGVGQQLDVFQRRHRAPDSSGARWPCGHIHEQQRQHRGHRGTGRHPAPRRDGARARARGQRRMARLRQPRAHRAGQLLGALRAAARACAARTRCCRAVASIADSCPELSQLCAQRLQRTKIMRLDAALRAFHRRRGFRDVQSFKIAQQKRLPLARRQSGQRPLQRLPSSRPIPAARAAVGRLIHRLVDRIELASSSSSPRHGMIRHDAAAHAAPALHVADAVLQDAIEQRLPFLGRTRGVAASSAASSRPAPRRAHRLRDAARSVRS